MRGLCFVKQDDGSYRSFRMLHKFFNLNETIGYQYEDLRDKKILYVQEKMDGSLIRFIPLPSGRIIAKTKNGFDNDQTKLAMELYEANEDIQKLVCDDLHNGIATLFELVGEHRIVLRYKKKELILIQRRVEWSGAYVSDFGDINRYYPSVSTSMNEYNQSLDSLMAWQRTLTDREGWVVTFEDGQVVKVKTNWYFSLHRLLTEDIRNESVLVESIMNEQADDIVAQLDDEEDKQFVRDMEDKIYRFLKVKTDYVFGMLDMEFDPNDRKAFAIDHKNDQFFSTMMSVVRMGINEDNALECVKQYVLKQCRTQSEARNFLKELP
jgi:T4 RnlA family RNA ligase